MEDRQLYSIPAFCKKHGVEPHTLRRWVASGKLPVEVMGGRMFLPDSAAKVLNLTGRPWEKVKYESAGRDGETYQFAVKAMQEFAQIFGWGKTKHVLKHLFGVKSLDRLDIKRQAAAERFFLARIKEAAK